MMKKSLFLMVAVVLLLSLSVLSPVFAEGFPTGEWAVTADAAEPLLQLNADGTAQYRGTAYTFEDDGSFLLLTDSQGEVLRLRYRITETDNWLYMPTPYTRKEGTTGEGIRGIWNQDGSEKGFFEFSEKDTFLEDGVFDGIYKVDYDEGWFMLSYPQYFGDTVCYFTIDGNHMTVEYPWKLVERKPAE